MGEFIKFKNKTYELFDWIKQSNCSFFLLNNEKIRRIFLTGFTAKTYIDQSNLAANVDFLQNINGNIFRDADIGTPPYRSREILVLHKQDEGDTLTKLHGVYDVSSLGPQDPKVYKFIFTEIHLEFNPRIFYSNLFDNTYFVFRLKSKKFRMDIYKIKEKQMFSMYKNPKNSIECINFKLEPFLSINK